MAAKSIRTLYLLLHLFENQYKTTYNSVVNYAKQLYMNNTPLGSMAFGFDQTLKFFGHADC